VAVPVIGFGPFWDSDDRSLFAFWERGGHRRVRDQRRLSRCGGGIALSTGFSRSLQHMIVPELSVTDSFHSRRPGKAVDGQARALPSDDETRCIDSPSMSSGRNRPSLGRDGVTGGGGSLMVVSTPMGRSVLLRRRSRRGSAPRPQRPTRQERLNRRPRPAAAGKPGGGCGRCPVAVAIPVVCHRAGVISPPQSGGDRATPPGGGAFTRVPGGLRRRPSSRCGRRPRSLVWAGEETGPGPLQPGLRDVTMMTPSVRT
jgi:hypothetical protein